MKLFNTLTRQKEEFVPITPGEVKMYSCGPTVYNYFHVGNARPFIVFDLLRRYFEYRGYKVKFVQNFTDIDDKVINKANEEGVDFNVIADRYIKEYYVDAEGLGIGKATVHPRATETMDNGHAYLAPNGDVYFRTKSDPDYGKLCHQPMEELQAGARISVGEQKEDPMDFAVWKAAKPGEPAWDTPWGSKGRPGWHIECSAMVNKYLGPTIDIHSGGLDLIFPHHENEIAQSEALTGKRFVRYWTHNGLIKVNGQKMSKSLGNSLLLDDLMDKFSPDALKFALLSSNYRNDVNVTDDLFPAAEAHVTRFYKLIGRAERAFPDEAGKETEIDRKFDAAMEDDFNAALALADLYGYFREVARLLDAGDARARRMTNQIRETYALLGLFRQEPAAYLARYAKEEEIPAEVTALAEERRAARAAKDWAKSDELREKLRAMGYAVKDGKDGYTLSRL